MRVKVEIGLRAFEKMLKTAGVYRVSNTFVLTKAVWMMTAKKSPKVPFTIMSSLQIKLL